MLVTWLQRGRFYPQRLSLDWKWYAKPISNRIELTPCVGIKIVFKRERFSKQILTNITSSGNHLQFTERQFDNFYRAIKVTLKKIQDENIL